MNTNNKRNKQNTIHVQRRVRGKYEMNLIYFYTSRLFVRSDKADRVDGTDEADDDETLAATSAVVTVALTFP